MFVVVTVWEMVTREDQGANVVPPGKTAKSCPPEQPLRVA